MKIHPVILSGGAGTRLWPLSRSLYPKQFWPLASKRSMLQETALRVRDNDRFHPPYVIGGDEHRFILAEQLRALGVTPQEIVLEPEGRNTAPAVAVAALQLSEEDPSALMLVLPSDHVIKNEGAFIAATETAQAAAEAGWLVTFGVTPNKPETGYGYIHQGAPLDGIPGCLAVERFVEKPERESAEEFLAAGSTYWNAGIFMFRAARYLEELERLHPDMVAACRMAVAGGARDLDFFRLDGEAFAGAPQASIDTAVMERTSAAAVVPVEMGWSDVGSWAALWEIGEKDEAGNVVHGESLVLDVRNSYIRSEGPLVTAAGVEDLVVIAAGDAVLVVSRDKAQDVKALAEKLKAEDRPEFHSHATVYRPWGSYQTIDSGKRFQVKRITVNPGAQLSLQMHHHRAEHWVVVKGTARATRGEETILLQEDQSIYIPLGTVHRLENPGQTPLELIEVQSGDYLGEDDIVRLDDRYGRS